MEPEGRGRRRSGFCLRATPVPQQRLDTLAQLEYERDIAFEPDLLNILRRRIAVLEKFSRTSRSTRARPARQIFNLQNSVKAIDGEDKGLKDPHVMDTKRDDETKFKAAVMEESASWKAKYGGAWDEIAEAEQ